MLGTGQGGGGGLKKRRGGGGQVKFYPFKKGGAKNVHPLKKKGGVAKGFTLS